MEYINRDKAIIQCDDIFSSLYALDVKYTGTDINYSDTKQEAFNALHEAMEAFRKLRNGL